VPRVGRNVAALRCFAIRTQALSRVAPYESTDSNSQQNGQDVPNQSVVFAPLR
jgi:hypothetical protein